MSDTRPKSKKTHERRSDTAATGFAGLFLSAFKSALISLAASMVLSVGASAITISTSDPDIMVLPLSLAILYISSFLSGFICIRRAKESPLLCALFSGGILMILYMLISLFFPAEMSQGHTFWLSLILHALIILFSFFGAYAGRHKSKRKIRR